MVKLLVLSVFLICLQLGMCIRCFVCNSANNSKCVEPTWHDRETIDKFLRVVECTDEVEDPRRNFFCRKIVHSLNIEGTSKVLVTRGCGWVPHDLPCYTADNHDHLETVCQCHTDVCNMAARGKGGLILPIVASLAKLIVWK